MSGRARAASSRRSGAGMEMPMLAEDLGRQCFQGFEEADAEQLRGMVLVFLQQAQRASALQQRALSRLAGTAETMSAAQARLQDLQESEVEAEARAASYARELRMARLEVTGKVALEEAKAAVEIKAASLEREVLLLRNKEARAASLSRELAAATEELRVRSALVDAEAQAEARARHLQWELSTMREELEEGRAAHSEASGAAAGSAEAPGGAPPEPAARSAVAEDGAEAPKRKPGRSAAQRPCDLAEDGPPCLAEGELSGSSAVPSRYRNAGAEDVVAWGSPGKPGAGSAALELGRSSAEAPAPPSGAGVRYLLSRKQGQPADHPVEAEARCPAPPDASCWTPETVETSSPLGSGQESTPEAYPSHSSRFGDITSPASPAASAAASLVDRLYDECLARGGGRLCGALDLRHVLLDIAGESACAAEPRGPVGEPPELLALLQRLGASVDSSISRAQFRGLVESALRLRQSQEVKCYESSASLGATAAPLLLDAAPYPPQEARRDLALSLQAPPSWPPLPSWSMEISPQSCSERKAVEAAQHWQGVGGAISRLAGLLEAPGPARQDWAGALQELQADLAALVTSLAEDARARLRASHASSGRLLEQRKRAVDGLTQQLEEQDIELQHSQERCAELSMHLKAVSAALERVEEAEEALATRTEAAEAASSRAQRLILPVAEVAQQPRQLQSTASLTESAQQPRQLESTASLAESAQWSLQATCQQRAEEVQALWTRLEASELQRNRAEETCQELQRHCEALAEAYEEDAQIFRGGGRCPGAVASSSTVMATSLGGRALEKELRDVARSVALRQAEAAEQGLREELREGRKRTEEEAHQAQRNRDEAAAVEAAALEERVAEMHAGTWFQKVAFRRQVRQSRFVRLTFDLKRIEWGPSQQGPMKALPVDAVLRVDFGDASRSFRCFEFGKHAPPPTQCMSISTPSRSLDLIALSEHDIETWVLGLNEVVTYHPERQRFTSQEFYLRRALLKLEVRSPETSEVDSETLSGSSKTSKASTLVGKVLSLRSGSEGGGARAVRRFLTAR